MQTHHSQPSPIFPGPLSTILPSPQTSHIHCFLSTELNQNHCVTVGLELSAGTWWDQQ